MNTFNFLQILNTSWLDLQDFEKAQKESEEKKVITKQLNDTMSKVMKKLDMEVSKFRCELEADNAGITEIIEKRKFSLFL